MCATFKLRDADAQTSEILCSQLHLDAAVAVVAVVALIIIVAFVPVIRHDARGRCRIVLCGTY